MNMPLTWAVLGKCKEKGGQGCSSGDLGDGSLSGLGPVVSASAPPESLLELQHLPLPYLCNWHLHHYKIP